MNIIGHGFYILCNEPTSCKLYFRFIRFPSDVRSPYRGKRRRLLVSTRILWACSSHIFFVKRPSPAAADVRSRNSIYYNIIILQCRSRGISPSYTTPEENNNINIPAVGYMFPGSRQILAGNTAAVMVL